jgi:hypothetical protein
VPVQANHQRREAKEISTEKLTFQSTDKYKQRTKEDAKKLTKKC